MRGGTGDGREATWRMFQDLLALAGPISLVTALLYYFGRASAQSFYGYFGVSLGTLNLSTTAYLVGTGDTLFRPVATLLLAAILLPLADALYRRLVSALPQTRRSWPVAGVLVLGTGAAGFGLSAVYGSPGNALPALALACGAVLIEYGLWATTRFARPAPMLRETITATARVRRGSTVAVVGLAAFWAVTISAHDRGAADARAVEEALPILPQAVVYSDKDLNLPGPRVAVSRLTGDGTAHRFRYNGLRPLTYANNRWFLLPVGWRHDNGSTIIVLEDATDGVRVDLAPGTALDPVPR